MYKDIDSFVSSLIGPIRPIADESCDSEYLENQVRLQELTESLIIAIDSISQDFQYSPYESQRKASEVAQKWLDNLGIQGHFITGPCIQNIQ